MPRFKPADYGLQFLAVDLSKQLHPGSSENAVSVQANVSWANVKRSGRNQYALHHLIEHEIDLTEIEARYKNEHEGAAAYDPRVLLKIVLLAYSRGIVSSRSMEAACCTCGGERGAARSQGQAPARAAAERGGQTARMTQ